MADPRYVRLFERLRRSPSVSTLPGTLPVLFFGDLYSANVATVGLNPSHQEYVDRQGNLLRGCAQRFATIDSLGAADRSLLTDDQCAKAIEWMRNYFDPGKPIYSSWFNSMRRVADGFGASFGSRSCVHLDLVQESTKLAWSVLGKLERAELLRKDLPFLEWEIRTFPLRAVLCNGRTVSTYLQRQLGVSVQEDGRMARLTWWVGQAHLAGRRVAFGGWNIPLARPNGLGREGETALGQLLSRKMGVEGGSGGLRSHA